jgi:hypothetical protein
MFWENEGELAGFFNDFGEPATLKDGTEITAIFEHEYASAGPMGMDIESSKPMAVVKSSDIDRKSVV